MSKKAILTFLKKVFWPEGLETMESYQRRDDDSVNGTFSIVFSVDGDAHISLRLDPNDPQCSARVRTGIGGGRSHYTLIALRVLAIAMEQDNLDHPSGENPGGFIREKKGSK